MSETDTRDEHDRVDDPTATLDRIGEVVSWAIEGVPREALDVLERFEGLVQDIESLDRHMRAGFPAPDQWTVQTDDTTAGYARVLALAVTDHLCRPAQDERDPEDIGAIVQAMAHLGRRAEATLVLVHHEGMDPAEAEREVAAHLVGQRGVWGYNAQGDRYHVCGKAFTEPAANGMPAQVMDCTDDYGHEGACSQ